MGLFSGLFGGGKTSVTQQAANNTTVEVGVGIEMDMGPVAAIMEWLGVKQLEQSESQQKTFLELLKSMQATEAAQQATDQKETEQQQQVIDTVLPWVNRLSFAAVAALAFFIWKKLK